MIFAREMNQRVPNRAETSASLWSAGSRDCLRLLPSPTSGNMLNSNFACHALRADGLSMLQAGFGRNIGAEGILGRETPSDSGHLGTGGRRDRVGAQSRGGGTQSPFDGFSSSRGSISTDLDAVAKSPSSLPNGCGGIRTPGGLSPTAVFKTAALDHSATHPDCVGEEIPATAARKPRPILPAPLFASPGEA